MAVQWASNFCATPQFPVRLKGRLADQPMEACSNKRQYELLRRMPILKFKLDSGCFTVENMRGGPLSKSKDKTRTDHSWIYPVPDREQCDLINFPK